MATLDAPSATADASSRASGSSFYLAMRLLPARKRRAMYHIYSFCRAVDDIADGFGSPDRKLSELRDRRADIDAIYAGRAHSHDYDVLADAIGEFDLRRDDFQSVIDGMEMDATGPIRSPDWSTLDLYCDRVASAVGRLCVRVFGMEDQAGIALAFHLGRALQLTNILRDLDEDADAGRLYLPREALGEAGIRQRDPTEVIGDPRVGQACESVAALARFHFEQANAILAESHRGTVRCPRVMAEAYRSLLEQLRRRGWQAPRQRVGLDRQRLLWILLCHALV